MRTEAFQNTQLTVNTALTGKNLLTNDSDPDSAIALVTGTSISDAGGIVEYVYRGVRANITEISGDDTLQIEGGITIEDLSFESFSNFDFLIITGPTGDDEIFIKDQLSSDPSEHIETILFTDDDNFQVTLSLFEDWLFVTDGDNNDNTILAGIPQMARSGC